MTTQRVGHLFPAFEFENGWRVSAQADVSGYQCSPRERLDVLEEYETVEVVIYGPSGHAVDGYAAGLPVYLAKKFSLSESNYAGAHITMVELSILLGIVRSRAPNSALPPGGDLHGFDHCKHDLVRVNAKVVVSFFGLVHAILSIDQVLVLRDFFHGWEELKVPENVVMQVSIVGAAFPGVRKQNGTVIMKTHDGYDVSVTINDVRTVLAAAHSSFANQEGSKFSIAAECRPQ